MSQGIEMGSRSRQILLPETQSNYDIRRSAHPATCIFHLVFKAAAVFSYMFIGLFLDSSFGLLLIVGTCDIFDYYVVKHMTGKTLVGLKWTLKVNGGDHQWFFEALPQKSSQVDSTIFWTFQFGFTAFWLVFGVLNLISFSLVHFIINLVGIITAGLNFYGYYCCSKEQQKKFNKMKQMVASKGLMYALNA